MKNRWIDGALDTLRAAGIEVAPGLSADELQEIESELHIRLPEDLKEFLSRGVPAGEGFPDWRRPRSEQMLEWLDEPSAGVEFDVEENGVWLDSWGERPDDIDDAIDEVHRLVNAAPHLIPLHRHHYLPAEPHSGGAPVLSVEASDVALIAPDLAWWFHRKWGSPAPDGIEPEPGRVPFWSDLLA